MTQITSADALAARDDRRLRLAVQKKGRLADDTFALLSQCGLTVRHSRSRLHAQIEELPIDLLLVRDDDIPGLVAGGASDAGLVGGNVAEEERLARREGREPQHHNELGQKGLGFSRCRLCIAVPKEAAYDDPSSLRGQRIATSYPALTQDWLQKNGVSDAEIVLMNGAHEIAPRIGLAEAICDIVSTGATLDSNGLKVAATIYESEAVLINAPNLKASQQHILDALYSRMEGALASRNAKYVMMNAPREAVEAIRAVLPGADAPTVLALAGDKDTVAIHVVCNEVVLWEQLEALKSLGARAILVLDIDKMLA